MKPVWVLPSECKAGYCIVSAWAVYLLKLEDVLVEVVLESLVGEVDAELFKAVFLSRK